MSYLRVIGLALLVFSASRAAPDAVDDYIRTQMKSQSIPGLALGIARNGRLVKAEGYGIADLDHDVPVTADTVFEVASITKPFTASLIIMLVEQGRLRLDDKVNAYLTDPPDAWRDVTIYHLLTHTAGLAPMGDDFKSMVWTSTVKTSALYAAAKADPMGSAPGEKWQYSDVGYFLLGMVIEKVTEQRYQDALSQRILTPLGMTSSRMLDHLHPMKHLARGYTLYTNPATSVQETVNIRRVADVELASHFGLFSTVPDLARWDAALYRDQPLKPASLQQMWTPGKLKDGSPTGYGFGWQVSFRRGHKIVGHTGITGTYILRVPDLGLTVIVLTNLGSWASSPSRGANAEGIGREVAGLVEPSLRLTPMTDPDLRLAQRLQGVFAGLAGGTMDSTLVSPSVAKEFADNKDGIVGFFGRLGPFRSIELVDRHDESGDLSLRYRVIGEKDSVIFLVRVNRLGTIVELSPE
jgi:CubicO group peptidase (beta-lactamase class C family)